MVALIAGTNRSGVFRAIGPSLPRATKLGAADCEVSRVIIRKQTCQFCSLSCIRFDGIELNVEIRKAKAVDAAEASAVLRRSITELCQADHGDDSAKITAWTANKTPEEWTTWLRQADVSIYVAVLRGRIAGVGAVTSSGEVRLNYVSPDARYCGVSKALLARMEKDTLTLGIIRCTLESTKTAYRFYWAAGYRPVLDNGVEGGWMEKRLVS